LTGTICNESSETSGITHIVSGAYIEKQTATERSEAKVVILTNLLDIVKKTSPLPMNNC
jgi:hypothetical protein